MVSLGGYDGLVGPAVARQGHPSKRSLQVPAQVLPAGPPTARFPLLAPTLLASTAPPMPSLEQHGTVHSLCVYNCVSSLRRYISSKTYLMQGKQKACLSLSSYLLVGALATFKGE